MNNHLPSQKNIIKTRKFQYLKKRTQEKRAFEQVSPICTKNKIRNSDSNR